MSKLLELHNYLREMVDSNDERLVIKDENLGVEIGLFDHAFSLSCEAKSELEKLQQDKAELVGCISGIDVNLLDSDVVDAFKDCDDSSLSIEDCLHDAICVYLDKLLKKHKCD